MIVQHYSFKVLTDDRKLGFFFKAPLFFSTLGTAACIILLYWAKLEHIMDFFGNHHMAYEKILWLILMIFNIGIISIYMYTLPLTFSLALAREIYSSGINTTLYRLQRPLDYYWGKMLTVLPMPLICVLLGNIMIPMSMLKHKVFDTHFLMAMGSFNLIVSVTWVTFISVALIWDGLWAKFGDKMGGIFFFGFIFFLSGVPYFIMEALESVAGSKYELTEFLRRFYVFHSFISSYKLISQVLREHTPGSFSSLMVNMSIIWGYIILFFGISYSKIKKLRVKS